MPRLIYQCLSLINLDCMSQQYLIRYFARLPLFDTHFFRFCFESIFRYSDNIFNNCYLQETIKSANAKLLEKHKMISWFCIANLSPGHEVIQHGHIPGNVKYYL